jgi:hypothetical protein
MVNFIDYETNYCRVFLAKAKDQAAKKFDTSFPGSNADLTALRTYGGLEYRNVDPFGKKTSVARQLTEPDSPVSNGKAEHMHRMILNIAR